MKPTARYATVVELLDKMFDSLHVPVDKIIHYYMKDRKYIGSKDRRFIIETFYKILRNINQLEPFVGHDSRLLLAFFLKHNEEFSDRDLEAVFADDEYGLDELTSIEKKQLLKPAGFNGDENFNLPSKFVELLKKDKIVTDIPAFSDALMEEAPLTLRVNKTKTSVDQILAQLKAQQIPCFIGKLSDHAIVCSKRFNLQETHFLKQGHIEVQDEGSQLMSLFCDVKSNMKVLDFCAGGGGKTLHLADLMNHKGQIFAHDIHTTRLQQLKKRAARAGVFNIQFISSLDEKFQTKYHHSFDCVLVDAPCSGSGTWRRNPDMRLKFNDLKLDELSQLQFDILQQASLYVKPQGTLVYVTCSVLQQENQDVIQKFLNSKVSDIAFEITEHFYKEPLQTLWNKLKGDASSTSSIGLNLLPHLHQTDGFYICRLKRIS